MINFHLFSRIFLLTFLTVVACKTDSSIVNPVASSNQEVLPGIKVTNGYLHFKDFKTYKLFTDKLDTGDQATIDKLKSIPDFESLSDINQSYLAGTENVKKRILDSNPNSFVRTDDQVTINTFFEPYSYLVNSNGIVRVEGYFFQYTRDYFKVLQSADDHALTRLYQATKDSPTDNITVKKVKHGTVSNKTGSKGARVGNFSQTGTVTWADGSYNLRYDYELYINQYQVPITSYDTDCGCTIITGYYWTVSLSAKITGYLNIGTNTTTADGPGDLSITGNYYSYTSPSGYYQNISASKQSPPTGGPLQFYGSYYVDQNTLDYSGSITFRYNAIGTPSGTTSRTNTIYF